MTGLSVICGRAVSGWIVPAILFHFRSFLGFGGRGKVTTISAGTLDQPRFLRMLHVGEVRLRKASWKLVLPGLLFRGELSTPAATLRSRCTSFSRICSSGSRKPSSLGESTTAAGEGGTSMTTWIPISDVVLIAAASLSSSAASRQKDCRGRRICSSSAASRKNDCRGAIACPWTATAGSLTEGLVENLFSMLRTGSGSGILECT